MCAAQTSSDISCESERTYSRLASGLANAYSTEARIAASAASTTSGSRPLAREDPRQRNGQARLAFPPLAEVGDRHEAVLCVGEAALVDDQPGVHVSRDDRVQDPVVAKLDHVAECGRREPEQQEGSRLAPRHGDATGRRFLERSDLARHHERPDSATQRRAASEQPVAVARRGGCPKLSLVSSNSASAARRFSSSMSSSTGSVSNGAGTSPCTSAWNANASFGHGVKPKRIGCCTANTLTL